MYACMYVPKIFHPRPPVICNGPSLAMNCAWYFSQPETKKYFERIIISITVLLLIGVF